MNCGKISKSASQEYSANCGINGEWNELLVPAEGTGQIKNERLSIAGHSGAPRGSQFNQLATGLQQLLSYAVRIGTLVPCNRSATTGHKRMPSFSVGQALIPHRCCCDCIGIRTDS